MGRTADERLTERTNPCVAPEPEFPRFLVITGIRGHEKKKYLALEEAKKALANFRDPVQHGMEVLTEDFSLRPITSEELWTFSRVLEWIEPN